MKYLSFIKIAYNNKKNNAPYWLYYSFHYTESWKYTLKVILTFIPMFLDVHSRWVKLFAIEISSFPLSSAAWTNGKNGDKYLG